MLIGMKFVMSSGIGSPRKALNTEQKNEESVIEQ